MSDDILTEGRDLDPDVSGYCGFIGLNLTVTKCDECYTLRASGTGAYIKDVVDDDGLPLMDKETGEKETEKVEYDGLKCIHRELFFDSVRKGVLQDMSADNMEILGAMKVETQMVKEGNVYVNPEATVGEEPTTAPE